MSWGLGGAVVWGRLAPAQPVPALGAMVSAGLVITLHEFGPGWVVWPHFGLCPFRLTRTSDLVGCTAWKWPSLGTRRILLGIIYGGGF